MSNNIELLNIHVAGWKDNFNYRTDFVIEIEKKSTAIKPIYAYDKKQLEWHCHCHGP